MYSEFLTDIEILCSNSNLTGEEKDAVLSFAMDNCDKLQIKAAENELLSSAFRKFKMSDLYIKFREYLKAKKSYNTDFDGEN